MTIINEFGFQVPDSQDEFGMMYYLGLSEKGTHLFDIIHTDVDSTYIKNSSNANNLQLLSSSKQLRLQSKSIIFTG